MKKNKIRAVAGLGLAQLALFGIAAHAQDTTRVLQDVAISATKINQKQSQTGKVVTVITRQQIERSAGKTLPELLNEQAGVMVNGANSNPGLNKSVYLRGASNKYTLVLIDGVLAFDPSNEGGAFDLRLLNIDQIDHIEIMKGGQSTLYGSDAVAGVINIVTRKDFKRGVHSSVLATAGSYGSVKGNASVNGQASSVLGYNINYTYMRTDGVSEAARPENLTAYFDKDGFNQHGLNTQFRIKATDRLIINPFFRYLYGGYKNDSGSFLDGNDTFSTRHLNTGTNAKYDLGKGAVNLNYSYENTTRNYRSDYGSYPYYGRLHFVDLYFNHQIGENVKVLIGFDDRYSKINANGSSKLDSSANLLGAYASVFIYDVAKVFNLEAGGRYNHHDRYGDNWTYSVTPAINVIADNKLKLFGTVSTSFRAPDLSALYGQFGANPNLRPEKSQSYEAGLSTALFDNVFNFRVVGYKRNITDAIASINYGMYFNQSAQNVKGIEIEPSLNIGKINLKGYYTILKARTLTQTTNGLVTNYFLARNPRNTASLFAGYQLTPTAFVSINYRYYGMRNEVLSDRIQPLKSYNLVDAYAEYGFLNRRLKVFADVKNIFNAKYAELYGYTALGTNFNAGLSYSIR